MYQKFWNQFLIEAAEPTIQGADATFALDNDEPTKPDPQPEPRALTGLKLFLSEQMFFYSKSCSNRAYGL